MIAQRLRCGNLMFVKLQSRIGSLIHFSHVHSNVFLLRLWTPVLSHSQALAFDISSTVHTFFLGTIRNFYLQTQILRKTFSRANFPVEQQYTSNRHIVVVFVSFNLPMTFCGTSCYLKSNLFSRRQHSLIQQKMFSLSRTKLKVFNI